MPKRYATVQGADRNPNLAMTEFSALLDGVTIIQVCTFNSAATAESSFNHLLKCFNMEEKKSS